MEALPAAPSEGPALPDVIAGETGGPRWPQQLIRREPVTPPRDRDDERILPPCPGCAPTHEDDIDARRAARATLLAVLPNAIKDRAVFRLTVIRLAIDGEFDKAAFAIILAGMLDGIDGRIARLLKAQSRFGAELDSLADSLSFGVAPALVLFLWSLHDLPRLGWFAALAFAICCALRLARFNAQIDVEEQPHKRRLSTGVRTRGSRLRFCALLWLASGQPSSQPMW